MAAWLAAGCDNNASSSDEESSALDKREYDVTCCCEFICCGNSTLMLEPEEAELTVSNICSETRKRLPYGELGDVDHRIACCCHSVGSALSQEGISPGCGCSAAMVEEIVEELKKRMKLRGDTGNILRAEQALKMMAHLSTKTEALLQYWALPSLQTRPSGPAVFPTKQYDVTDICHTVCCCGSKTLHLDAEEAVLLVTSLFSTTTSRRPYGQLKEVDAGTACGMCTQVSSSMGPMSPGFGCEQEKVMEIVEELKARMKARGDTGNMLRQEEINRLIAEQQLRLAEVCRKMGVAVPLAQPPVAQRMV